mmetsp:Transcript_1607/g.6195  ORF Transcript_1607/g.6195 Transcript_1607/m.6195 type:complete len:204 (-) Transcript_1607:220-831(-)
MPTAVIMTAATPRYRTSESLESMSRNLSVRDDSEGPALARRPRNHKTLRTCVCAMWPPVKARTRIANETPKYAFRRHRVSSSVVVLSEGAITRSHHVRDLRYSSSWSTPEAIILSASSMSSRFAFRNAVRSLGWRENAEIIDESRLMRYSKATALSKTSCADGSTRKRMYVMRTTPKRAMTLANKPTRSIGFENRTKRLSVSK